MGWLSQVHSRGYVNKGQKTASKVMLDKGLFQHLHVTDFPFETVFHVVLAGFEFVTQLRMTRDF